MTIDNLYYSWDRETDLIIGSDFPVSFRATRDERQVGWDEVTVRGVRLHVSTVFLIINHAYDDGEPILFETMVFAGRGRGARDHFCDRYRTPDQAREGHIRVVRALKSFANIPAYPHKQTVDLETFKKHMRRPLPGALDAIDRFLDRLEVHW